MSRYYPRPRPTSEVNSLFQGGNKKRDELDYMDFLSARVETPTKQISVGETSNNENEPGLLQFDCLGDCHPENILGKNSYFKASVLYNLMVEGQPFSDASLPIRPIWNALDPYNPSGCFNIIRKNIGLLRKECSLLNNGRRVVTRRRKNASELRKEVVDKLQSLSIHLCTKEDKNREFLHSLVFAIEKTFKYLGPLSNLPEHILRASSSLGNACLRPAYHLLHLYLDVIWWSLSILHQISYKFGDDFGSFCSGNKSEQMLIFPNSSESTLDSCLCAVTWDLINLMERKSSMEQLSNLFETKTWFHCTCMNALAILVFHLTDWRSRIYKSEALWSRVTQKLLEKLRGDKRLPEDTDDNFRIRGWLPPTSASTQNPQNYQIWWMFASFADIFKYDTEGEIGCLKITNLWQVETKMLRTLILVTIVKPSEGAGVSVPPEDELRILMRSCHQLLQLWEHVKDAKHSNWVTALWEHFHKHIGATFMVKGASLQAFASFSKSPAHFNSQIKRLDSNATMAKDETSWNIFLRILVWLSKCNQQEWKIVKVRIYLKFHDKKMNELSATGLYNTIMLFLAIANSVDHLYLCSKLCSLLNMVQSNDVQRLYTVVLGCLSACYLLLSKESNLKELADEVQSKIDDIVKRYASASNIAEKRDIGHSIVIYCEGVQELFKINCSLTLGQETLFCSSLGTFLLQASSVLQRSILGCLNLALNKVLETSQDVHSLANGVGVDILEAIWKNFHPFLNAQFRSQCPEALVAPVCASIVLCASRFENACQGPNLHLKDPSTLLSCVLGEESFTGSVALPFLTQLLRHSSGCEHVSKLYQKYDEKLVVILLNHLVENGSSEDVMAATEVLLSTPAIDELLGRDSGLTSTRTFPACPFGAFEMLVQKLSQSYAAETNFQSRLRIRDKARAYFSSFDKPLRSLLKKDNFPGHTQQVLDLVGCLFSHGSALLYSKGNSTCPLPKLLSAVILPISIYNMQKPLGVAFSHALWPLLPKVINGISSLGLDPYVSRCLKDIFASYVYRFSIAAHPFSVALNAENSSRELRRLFIYSMNIHYVEKSKCNLAQLQMVLMFLHELLKTDLPLWMDLVCELMFSPLVELLLFVVDLPTKNAATELLQKILKELRNEYVFLRGAMVESTRLFVKTKLVWSSERVFRILQVMAVLNRDLISDALPGIEAAIESVEVERGSGIHNKYRLEYETLVKIVNPSSQQ